MKERSAKTTCSLCGGQLQTGRVRVIRERGDSLGVFENVPAKVCQKCGHRYFNIKVVREMETRMDHPDGALATLEVLVFALQDA